jgi:hypothetical protein
MSHNRSLIEMKIMSALTISLHRVLKQIGCGLAAFWLMALVTAPLSAQTFRGTILGTANVRQPPTRIANASFPQADLTV